MGAHSMFQMAPDLMLPTPLGKPRIPMRKTSEEKKTTREKNLKDAAAIEAKNRNQEQVMQQKREESAQSDAQSGANEAGSGKNGNPDGSKPNQ